MNFKSNIIFCSTLLAGVALTGLAICEQPPQAATSQAIDPIALELYGDYIARVGKINTSSVQAAVVLVAERTKGAPPFQELLRRDFATSQQAENQGYDSRKLLSLITAILYREGGKRWQHEYEKQTGVLGQQVLPSAEYLYRESPLLADVIGYGRKCQSSEIDAVVFAVRQAHHPAGKSFLLDVLQSPVQVAPVTQSRAVRTQLKSSDNRIESSDEARFHAAVGLAELGIEDGVEWLIAQAEPNQFGLDGDVDRHPQAGVRTSSLRANCHAALRDLSGLPALADGERQDWVEWWQKNAATFTPRQVALLP